MVKESELGTQRYVFIYDNEGNPHALYYYSAGSTTPTKYYYVLNLQGDVVQLRNSSYAVVANYTYDAWGRLLSVKNASGSTISDASHIANVNPIRYRGYFYDTETKLYYCSSRYYDPQIKRFINADEFVSTGQDFAGYNMFAYCNNNPVVRSDPSGQFFLLDIISLATSIYEVVKNLDDPIAWAGLVGDTVDLIPGVTGVGEGIKALGAVDDVYGAVKAVDNVADIADDVHDTAKVLDTSTDFADDVLDMSVCFIAGTKVLTSSGYVAIENISEGDVVFAWNETTDEVELKRVVETYVNETDELIHLYVNGEKISTTPSHPFYSPVKGWTDAVNLRAGDILVLVNGEYVVLEKVQHEILESPIAVYNFQVEDDHTYYGGESGVLVHNACGPKNQKTFSTRKQAFNQAKRDLGIPTSQQPVRVTKAINRFGKTIPGRDYYFEGGKIIRNHTAGHFDFGRHFNVGDMHYFY